MRSSCGHFLVLVSTLCAVAEGKYQTGTVTIGGTNPENRWKYLSKFAYVVGSGKWQVRFKTVRPHLNAPQPLTADVYLDTDWEEVESKEVLCDRTALKRTAGSVDVPVNGEWSRWISGNLNQSTRPHVWYVAVHDCKNQFPVSTRVRWEFRAVQPDGSEFSAEMRGVWTVLFLQLFIYGAFGYWFTTQSLRYYRSNDNLHPVIIALAAALGLHVVSLALEFVHISVYADDGEGVKALNVLGQMAEISSQIVMSSLLILIALGYTLLHSGIGNLDILIPIVFIIGVVHLLLVGFGKIKDDASYKFSENEGMVGWILGGLRLGLLAWFIWGVNETKKTSSLGISAFLQKFRIAGAAYFLAFPLTLVLGAILFPPYHRHKAVVVGLGSMTLAGYVYLSQLFLGRGEFFKVSTLSSSFLPGGLKTGVDKEE